MHAPHSAADRIFDGDGFGQHAVLQMARFTQPFQAFEVRVGNYRARILDALENARRAGTKHQLLGGQRAADGGSHGIGVDIEQYAIGVRR